MTILTKTLTVSDLIAARIRSVVDAAEKIDSQATGLSLAYDVLGALRYHKEAAVVAFRPQVRDLNALVWPDDGEIDPVGSEIGTVLHGAIEIIRNAEKADDASLMIRALNYATAPHGSFKSFAGRE